MCVASWSAMVVVLWSARRSAEVHVSHLNFCAMANRRILVVEDEVVLIRILGDALCGAGYEVYTAANGVEGLAEFQRVHPDLVIADIMMPDMDGMTMVREIRKTNRACEVLFLSARSGVEDVCEGFKSGGNS